MILGVPLWLRKPPYLVIYRISKDVELIWIDMVKRGSQALPIQLTGLLTSVYQKLHKWGEKKRMETKRITVMTSHFRPSNVTWIPPAHQANPKSPLHTAKQKDWVQLLDVPWPAWNVQISSEGFALSNTIWCAYPLVLHHCPYSTELDPRMKWRNEHV